MPWRYVFLLGFEGQRSLQTYERFEPKYVSALIGKPGYWPNYEGVARSKNAGFIKLASPKIICANAGDAVETWARLEKHLGDMGGGANTCIVPLGTKPHALGGGLAALSSGTIGVQYLMPSSFNVRDVKRGKYLWLYKVQM